MQYPLYNLGYNDFENLVALICKEILGTGTIIFSQGKDGGRDALFTGRANNFPSSSKPWEGKFIIQAKHTMNPMASCSDSEFKSILKDEVKKIKKMIEDSKIDYYLIFTNRKLSGLQQPKISNFIDENLEIENKILGIETIQLWLKQYREIPIALSLHRLLIPFMFYEEDIRQIIVEFSRIRKDINLGSIATDYHKIPIQIKNELNNVGTDYFNSIIKSSYSEFEKIEAFLNDPQNEEYKEMYYNTVSDLQDEIMTNRNHYDTFDLLLNHLYKLIFDEENELLRKNRCFIRTFLHYMYCTCDIGKKE